MFRVTTIGHLVTSITARPEYAQRIPNAGNVVDAQGVKLTNAMSIGHTSTGRNAFGIAFRNAGFQWTRDFCLADSDGDGASNGRELGDPCCAWTVGAVPDFDNATNPGIADTQATLDRLPLAKCAVAPTSDASLQSTLISMIVVAITTMAGMMTIY
jgi:hypothetical protein